jgi:ABC-2 type transport system ATP-binding protein
MMEQPALLATDLSRSFGEFQAVKPLDFSLNAGEIDVLTGPNGAGKTTLLLCLGGLLRPTHGTVLVEGYDLYQHEREAKRRLAFVPDVPHFYQELTALEHIKFISLAFSVENGWEKRAEELLAEFGLWDYRNMYPHNLSRGMRLKLGIALALSRPFKVLLMDEPTSALDADSAAHLLDKINRLSSAGSAILISSHNINMADTLHAKRLRMDRGQLESDQ